MKTVAREAQIEFEEKKSKFIGYIKPISTKLEAEEFIEMIKRKHPDATHNCSAYRVVDNGQEYFKVDDDGEPSGTAGKPMGDILIYMEVENLVVVVTRYFGGIKLGAGGLIRNYAKTVKLAVQEAGIIEFIDKKLYLADFSYEKIGEVDTIIENNLGEVLEKDFNERVTYRVKLSEEGKNLLEEIKGILLIEL
jgi:uncharacterized YigZ family protein